MSKLSEQHRQEYIERLASNTMNWTMEAIMSFCYDRYFDELCTYSDADIIALATDAGWVASPKSGEGSSTDG